MGKGVALNTDSLTEGSKSEKSKRISKAPPKRKAKQIGQSQMRISPQGRLITAEEDSPSGLYDPEHA